MFLVAIDNTVINLAFVRALYVQEFSGEYRVTADLIEAETDVPLAGLYTTQAEAVEVMLNVSKAFDPSV